MKGFTHGIILFLIIGCSTSKGKFTGLEYTKLYSVNEIEDLTIYNKQFVFSESMLTFINIKKSVLVYSNNKLLKSIEYRKDSIESTKTIEESLRIKNKNNNFKKITIVIQEDGKMIDFYLDPKIPFYEIFYNDNKFYIYGLQGSTEEQ